MLAVAVATAGGVGFAPLAPGTLGALLAIPIFVYLSPLAPLLLALTWVALFCLGVWAADATEAAFGRHDDGRIVIDEVAGQLLTYAPLLAGDVRSPAWLVTGFVAFRVFDMWKPGPVRWAERRFAGGLGVMLDDTVAGVLGAGVLLALRASPLAASAALGALGLPGAA